MKIKHFFAPLLLACLSIGVTDAAASDSLTMTIPQRAGDSPVSAARLLLDVVPVSPATSGSPTFSLSNKSDCVVFNFAGEAILDGASPPSCASGANCIEDHPECDAEDIAHLDLPDADDVIYAIEETPDLALSSTDPYRHRFIIALNSNSDPGPDEANPGCDNALTKDESWTITVNGNFEIAGACLLGFVPDLNCLPTPLVAGESAVLVDDSGQEFSASCENLRPGVEALLVLDRSGSMGSPATAGGEDKISVLHGAVRGFVDVWQALRAAETESTQTDPPEDDTLGVIAFSGDADVWQARGSFESVKDDIRNNIGNASPEIGLTAGGMTSIGDGLCEAAGEMTAAASRRVMLLMSDGMETAPRYVASDNGAGPVTVSAACAGAASSELPVPGDGAYQIYAITVGEVPTLAAEVNNDLADASGGFYQSTTTSADADLLPFFLRALQNFLAFNTWQTVLMVADETATRTSPTANLPTANLAAISPGTAERAFSLTSTAAAVSINAFVADELELVVTPPAGDALVRTGFGHVGVALSAADFAPNGLEGDWTIALRSGAAEHFTLAVFADDFGVHGEFDAAFDDFEDHAIIATARMEEMGMPLTGIGSELDGEIRVRLLVPETTVGDVLSDSDASGKPEPDSDLTPAEVKLANTLAADPGALARSEQGLPLRDDGTGGDATAGDGIYTGTIPVDAYGHYDLLFLADVETTRSGRVMREHHQSVYVRALPSPEATEVITTVAGDTLDVQLLPRTANGHRLGPGWAPYFWVTTDDGRVFKALDGMDGSYGFVVPVVGSVPEVSIHFIPDSVTLPADIAPEDLPSPLDGTTVLVADVGADADDGLEPVTWWWLLLLILALLLLIVIVYAMRKAGSAP
jgi:hypothetical protein